MVGLLYRPVECGPAASQQNHLVEQLEGSRSRLVHRAYDQFPANSQSPESGDDSAGRPAIETCGWFVAEEDWRVVQELEYIG